MLRRAKRAGQIAEVTPALLRDWPLEAPDSRADKDGRGTILVAGGSVDVPGGVILAGLASLRAGAGKLQIAAPRSIALPLGVAVPEARVFSLSESKSGSLEKKAGRELRKLDEQAQAIVLGPGMVDEKKASAFTKAYLRRSPAIPTVIDAACLSGLRLSRSLGPNVLLTPHAGEMAAMLGVSKKAVEKTPMDHAVQAAARSRATVILKGARTFIAVSYGVFTYDGGDVGLATSGSGDVLAGIIAGLLARGAPIDQAAVWGVAIHGAAGAALQKRIGKIGYLARELLDEIPRAMLKTLPR